MPHVQNNHCIAVDRKKNPVAMTPVSIQQLAHLEPELFRFRGKTAAMRIGTERSDFLLHPSKPPQASLARSPF